MWNQYVAILTWSLPGFLAYALVYRACVPGRLLSDIEVTYRSLMWSAALSIGAWFTGEVRGIEIAWSSSGTVLWLLGAGAASGWLLALLERKCGVQSWLFTLARFPKSRWPDCWSVALDLSIVGAGPVWVYLVDGTTYYGIPGWVSESGDPQELILEGTWVWYPGKDEPEELGRMVYIRGAAIGAIMSCTWADIKADSEAISSNGAEGIKEGVDNER